MRRCAPLPLALAFLALSCTIVVDNDDEQWTGGGGSGPGTATLTGQTSGDETGGDPGVYVCFHSGSFSFDAECRPQDIICELGETGATCCIEGVACCNSTNDGAGCIIVDPGQQCPDPLVEVCAYSY